MQASERAVVEANVSNVDIARERERGSGRENSWPGCHGHRPHSSRHDECVNSQGGRHDGNSYGRLAVHSGDAMSPDTRRELVGSRLMVLVQPAGGGGVQRERCRKGRAQSSPLCLLPVLQKKGRGGEGREVSRRSETEARVVGVEASSGGEAAHARRIGIDPTSRQHLVAPHVPR